MSLSTGETQAAIAALLQALTSNADRLNVPRRISEDQLLPAIQALTTQLAALAPLSSGSSSVAGCSASVHQRDGGVSKEACQIRHNKSQAPNRQSVQYDLYSACLDGCVECVQKALNAAGATFNINTGSYTYNWTALDHARWAKLESSRKDYDGVIKLLEARGAVSNIFKQG